ncbi:hypothetical protein BD289DRAFT_463501 [Coniella lustricola]|uniref:D-serine dehydratase-like domain-containing protein n=1 Tax=Coniella lustricola TaxID=2025994 RepID=A0A2T2ZVH1_9PEZI|nr:hypothetical protein BD289DRAFT_463501 [Coniella lustricola]
MATYCYAPQVGDPLSALDTPSMLVDLSQMESNIATLMDTLLPSGVLVRPHLKTTKCAALAARLAAVGATGACVAKLSEAEVLCAKGCDDLLITCVIVGAVKVQRLVELVRRHRRVRIVVDDAGAASAIDAALGRAGFLAGKGADGGGGRGGDDDAALLTLVDVDVGLHRTGVQPGAEARKLARHVAGLQYLRLIGVQGYEGHVQHVHGAEARSAMCRASMALLTRTADELRADGHAIDVVTAGGTGTAEVCAAVAGVTEVQPGSFLFMDTDYRNAIGEAKYKSSLTILSTVLSAQGPRTVTIDAGLKSLTTDSGLAETKIKGYMYGVLGDEHGSLTWEEEEEERLRLKVGDRVEMVPSHIDPTINLHDVYYAHRDGVVEEIWTVDARGKVQ